MIRCTGTIAGAVVIMSFGLPATHAGMIGMPVSPPPDTLPFAVASDMLSGTLTAPGLFANRILPDAETQLPFEGLGVMSTLTPLPGLAVEAPPTALDPRDWIAMDITIDQFGGRTLPLEIPQLGSARSRGTILDVFFVIPSPGAIALAMVGCCGAVRRRR